MYSLYLNGKFYGSGPLEYMNELIRDYVVICQMYGKKKVSFDIEEGFKFPLGQNKTSDKTV